MARQREFDLDEALDTALDTFWQRGYEATSVDHLAAQMKLKKGSIYRAFGNKHDLFLKSLQCYLDRHYRRFKELVRKAESPRQAIEYILSAVVDMVDSKCRPKGCFATNSLVELGPHDEQVAELLDRQRQKIEEMLRSIFSEGQSSGEFRKDLDPEALSSLTYSLIGALMSDSKHRKGRERTRKQADAFLSLIMSEHGRGVGRASDSGQRLEPRDGGCKNY